MLAGSSPHSLSPICHNPSPERGGKGEKRSGWRDRKPILAHQNCRKIKRKGREEGWREGGKEEGREKGREGGRKGSISTASSLFKGTSGHRKGSCSSPSTSLFPVQKIIQVVPLLVFHMTKPHGSLIIPRASWLPLPSYFSACRARQGCRPGHTTHPFPPSFPQNPH